MRPAIGHRSWAQHKLVWAAWCVVVSQAAWAAPLINDPNLVVETVATGFTTPTGIGFIAPDDALVIEQYTGKVIRTSNSATVLDLNVVGNSERGLLGIEVHPDFDNNPYVYLYYTRTTSTTGDGNIWAGNQLSRFTWDGSALVNEEPLLNFPPRAGQASGPNHNGGPLVFGTDGQLYGVTGDLNRSGLEQNTIGAGSSDVGGVYRLNDDGSIPVDNPFVSPAPGPYDELYAYGVRNSFGLAVDPVTGNIWNTENGPGSYDEINLVAPGFNSGWTKLMGPDSRDPQGVADLVTLPGSAYSDPEFSWNETVAPTDLVFPAGSSLGAAYDNVALVGDFNTGQIFLLPLNAARNGFELGGGLADLVADGSAERDSVSWGTNFGVATEMKVGPDGALYVVSYFDGAVYRISAIPEPSTWLLGLSGVALLVGLRWRRGKG